MSVCPVCKQSIPDAFGIIQCPNCRTMLIAEFDGTLKVHGEESSLSEGGSAFLNKDPQEQSGPLDEASSFDVPAWNSEPELTENSLDHFGESPQHTENDLEKNIPATSKEIADSSVSKIENILEFAESKNASLPEGEYVYTLYCKDVHTLELQTEILEYLRDKRLSVGDQNIQIRGSEIQIKGLNPVKLSILINKIKSFPVHIQWTQTSLTH